MRARGQVLSEYAVVLLFVALAVAAGLSSAGVTIAANIDEMAQTLAAAID
jgi:Flp pilus assembly pilin Flp